MRKNQKFRHYFLKDPEKRNIWVKRVEKELNDFAALNNKVVLS